jgi:hypothetical protein
LVAGQSFDLIIAVLGPAIRAVLPPGSELFPGVPLVFCLLPETLKEMKLGPQVAGVVIKLDPKGTLELALKAQPDTRQVVVIAGKPRTIGMSSPWRGKNFGSMKAGWHSLI